MKLLNAPDPKAPEKATFFGAIKNLAEGWYTAKLANYAAASPTVTTRIGGRIGTNANSTYARIQQLGLGFTAEMVTKDNPLATAYLAQRQNYCSSMMTYIPSTPDEGFNEELSIYLHGYDGHGGIFSRMGSDCSMQDAFLRTADLEVPVRGDGGMIFWRDASTQLRLIEWSADQLGEIYNFTQPRTCSLVAKPSGAIVEVAGSDCIYYAGRYFRGPDCVAYKIYERTDSWYANPRIYDAEDVLYFKDPANFRGVRGVTIFAAAIISMQKGEDMLQAALAAAQRQARTAFYVTNDRGGPDETSYESDIGLDGFTTVRERVPGGPLVEYGYTGETMAAVSPDSPGPELIQGVQSADERVCLALRMPYAVLVNPNNVGGAPSRLEVEKADKEFQRLQNMIHRPQLRRIIDMVLMEAINTNAIIPPRGMTVGEFKRGRWMLPISPSVDAFYDAKENIAMIRSGLESPQDVIAETNRDWRDVMRKKTEFAEAASRAVQDANKRLKTAGYKGDVTAADIVQVSDNPQEAAQAEAIDGGDSPQNKLTAKMSEARDEHGRWTSGNSASEHAEKKSREAFVADKGSDRGLSKRMHRDAQDAHEDAAKAYRSEGKDDYAEYHDEKAKEHEQWSAADRLAQRE